MSLKDAMLKAYADAGMKAPETNANNVKKVVVAPGSKGKKQLVVVRYGPSSGGKAARARKMANEASDVPKQVIPGDSFVRGVSIAPNANSSSSKSVRGAAKNHNESKDSLIEHNSNSVPQDFLGANAKCLVSLSDGISRQLLDLDLAVGCWESIHQLSKPEVHEIALGLDFGTSSVKVVIGDLSSDKTYAVPFLVADGADSYLLPSRIFESNDGHDGSRTFNLSQGEFAFRDLKLSLLGDPDNVDRQVEVIAFLSLVIQRCRAWFFETHSAVYKRVKCIWQLRIGLPAATALNNKYAPLLEQVMRSAWQVAAMSTRIDRAHVQLIRDRILGTAHHADEPEVSVIPEIAAQIFGFVVSNSFDRNAANRYLMVDVGAGTVDSSLFKVFPGRGGRWNFEFYTAVVQPYGVANLHAYRVEWWCEKLNAIEGAQALCEEIAETRFATDISIKVPAHNRDYFQDVHISNESPDHPDLRFFEKLMSQVQGSTMWRAWRDGFLAKDQLTHTPMFLCGGGARSNYYLELENKLVRAPSFSWLSAESWQLGYPSDLVADGINEVDFDRLSVAYGLSKLNVGQITQALPLPRVPPEDPKPFTDRYIDKDQT
jgi:hypothetical protein